MSSSSYGYTYLTSYGWTGSGTGLRKGAMAKPLAIPQKKNLGGLGNDRDEAFPFWDHVFAAASRAITIKVSSDDESEDEPENPYPETAPLHRTVTGILSNRRPISGTPASTSGGSTPSLVPGTDAGTDTGATGRLSLLATAKREAAKRGLYARFFRGPVLGLDQDLDPCRDVTCYPAPSSSEHMPAPEQVGDEQEDAVGGGGTENSKKRKSEDRAETREERRKRKRSKRERKAARAAEKAEREQRLTRDKLKKKKDRFDRNVHKCRNEMRPEESHSKKAGKEDKKSAGPAGDDLEPPKTLEGELASTNNSRQDMSPHRSPSNLDTTDASNVAPAAKKKNRKQKDTPS